MDAPEPPADTTLPMTGFPPPPELRVTLDNWDSPPFNTWAFQNMRQVFPTAEVWRGSGHAAKLPASPEALGEVAFTARDGAERTLEQMLAATHTHGFLMLHRGRVVYERYLNGMTERSLHLSQSVAKSVVAAAAGVLWGEGLLDLEAPVRTYVPETAGLGYGDALIRHLLDMTSGVGFNEDYADPDSDISRFDRAAGWKPWREGDASCAYDFLLTLQQSWAHGEHHVYRSSETDMLGWVLEQISGTSLSELVSRTVWSNLGCERDACFVIDRAGAATANGGFNATLRDYARFGQMQLQRGHFNRKQIVPQDWSEAAFTGDRQLFEASPYAEVFPKGAYSRKWWVLDRESGQHCARGIFGQLIYVDPEREVVAVKLSAWPTALNLDFLLDTLTAIETASKELSEG
ncbi:MAG: serine hydrolase [Pseudomonadota bacterium]